MYKKYQELKSGIENYIAYYHHSQMK
ncbi:hypothetical protein [Brochothrix thermosphacta]